MVQQAVKFVIEMCVFACKFVYNQGSLSLRVHCKIHEYFSSKSQADFLKVCNVLH